VCPKWGKKFFTLIAWRTTMSKEKDITNRQRERNLTALSIKVTIVGIVVTLIAILLTLVSLLR
jgi:hypothetical protein